MSDAGSPTSEAAIKQEERRDLIERLTALRGFMDRGFMTGDLSLYRLNGQAPGDLVQDAIDALSAVDNSTNLQGSAGDKSP